MATYDGNAGSATCRAPMRLPAAYASGPNTAPARTLFGTGLRPRMLTVAGNVTPNASQSPTIQAGAS